MKNIKTFINEKLDIEQLTNGYRIVTLVSRNDVDCENISKADFISYMFDDLTEAESIYTNEMKKLSAEKLQKYKEKMKEKFIEYAEKKWKTEKKRNEYISTMLSNIDKRDNYVDTLSYVDLELKHDRLTIRINDSLKKTLSDYYSKISSDELFKKAKGWAVKYEASKETLQNAFRPYIYLILDENTRKQVEDDKAKHAENIMKFYSDEKYWGD